LRAPATISAAEAEPPFTSTTMGAPLSSSPGVALISNFDSAVRPLALTITPESRNASATATAASSTPPGLLRRSSTSPLSGAPFSCAGAERGVSSSPVVSLNCAMRT
jgi:hypothetical protein